MENLSELTIKELLEDYGSSYHYQMELCDNKEKYDKEDNLQDAILKEMQRRVA